MYSDYPEVDILLYIDRNTLITDFLQELWNTDRRDYLGAACLGCMNRIHKKIIESSVKDNYMFTGILLLNVSRWKQEDIDSQMIDFIQKYKGKTEYVDQGVINGTISNRFLLVNPRYNLTSLAYDFTYEEMLIYRKPDFGYSKEEWEKAIEKPAIVHFTTSFLSIRPWYEGSKHPYAKQWKETHDETEWKDVPYRELMARKKRDKKEWFYRKLPRKIAVGSAGILHAYVKPLLYYLK